MIKGHPQYMLDFCINIVTKTIVERERNNTVQKDLMQCLIQLRNNSDIKADAGEWEINAGCKFHKYGIALEEIAAQVFRLLYRL